MAEIPVEKKSSLAWLWWLLLLAGILALLYFLFFNVGGDADDDLGDDVVLEQTVEDSGAIGTTADTAPGVTAITGVAGLTGLADMIGRDVELTGVAVNRLVGDEGFTVGEGANETLVMFDEEPTPNTPMEGTVDVNPGSRVTISGEVQAFPGDLPQNVTEDLSASNSNAMIFANSVEVVE